MASELSKLHTRPEFIKNILNELLASVWQECTHNILTKKGTIFKRKRSMLKAEEKVKIKTKAVGTKHTVK